MEKRWIVIIILTILVLGIIISLTIKGPEGTACTKEAKICPDGTGVGRTGPNCEFSPCPLTDEAKLNICRVNSDCIIVNYNSCCGSTKKSINKEYLTQYNSNPEWQVFNDPQICETIGICPDDKNITESKCENSKCVLVYN